jgi:prepilin-type N-terminal cleavage/methylation domain-containing protein
MTTTAPVTDLRSNLVAPRPRGRGRGFTLIELLIVIGIIILVLAVSVPVIRIMSGSGSVDGAQNMVSAMLQRARSRAIGMQGPRGVFFFEDQATKRTAMLLVKIDEAGLAPNADARVIELDDAAEEMQLLPANVGVAFLLGQKPSNGPPGGAQTETTYRPFGLIAFDGLGRVMLVPSYMLLPDDTKAATQSRYPPNGITQLVDRFRQNADHDDALKNLGTTARATPADQSKQEFSHTALMLFDKVAFAEKTPSGSPLVFTSGAGSQSEWLDNNGVALAVNRYTGTLLRGE